MPDNRARQSAGGSAPRPAPGRLALALLLTGLAIGFTARCGVSALFVNVGSLAVLRGADDLAASAFDAAAAVDPASPAATNFRLSQALLAGDYEQAADDLTALRAGGGTPQGVAGTSSVVLHLDAILARRAGSDGRALALVRESVARAGVNAPESALRLLDKLSRDMAKQPYGPALATVELPVDPRRNTCGHGRRLARVRLSRNDVAIGGPVRAEPVWADAEGVRRNERPLVLRNLVPNGAFTWGRTSDDVPLGFTAQAEPRVSGATPPGDMHVGFADLDGRPVAALIIDNLDGSPTTSRLRSHWIPAAPGACYLLASEVWVDGGEPHFGLYLRARGEADRAVFGLQGGLPDGWRREARLIRLPGDTEAVQVFFWNYRSNGAAAFTLAFVARIDA
ncbi:MAG: hypothetical protein OXP73_04210 [Chloroflexota bacterium]|nr:hypothetical protein [Chloroflexota bacterium]